MARPRAGILTLIVAIAFVAAGCASGSSANGSTGNVAGATAGVPGNGGGNGGGAPAAGGNLTKVDACSLLTPAEIQQSLGIAFANGTNQDSDIVKQCEWDPQDGSQTLTVGIIVRTFDEQDWQVVAEFPHAAAVSGLGEGAYKDSPLSGDLSVKFKGYEIDLGIVNFSSKSQTEIDQANVDLMKLVLNRL